MVIAKPNGNVQLRMLSELEIRGCEARWTERNNIYKEMLLTGKFVNGRSTGRSLPWSLQCGGQSKRNRHLNRRVEKIFRHYVLDRPLDASDPDVWSADVELGWPWA